MSALKIGSWQTIRYFNGKIDDFQVYNRVLTASEILGLYNAGTVYTITTSAGSNGSISPSGAISVNYGANKTFRDHRRTPATPSCNVTVDGVSLRRGITSYTFNNVIANHTISAAFARPVGMANRSALTDTRAPGRAVVIWGKVKSIDGTTSFTINDGYSGDVTVMIDGAQLPTGFDTTKTAIVVGVLSADRKVHAQVIRAIP